MERDGMTWRGSKVGRCRSRLRWRWRKWQKFERNLGWFCFSYLSLRIFCCYHSHAEFSSISRLYERGVNERGERIKERLDPIQLFGFPPLLCTFPRNLLALFVSVYLRVNLWRLYRPRKARDFLPKSWVASDRRKIIIDSCEPEYWLDQLPEHGSSFQSDLLTFPRIRQSRLLRPKSTRFRLSSSSRPQIHRGNKPPGNRVDSQ